MSEIKHPGRPKGSRNKPKNNSFVMVSVSSIVKVLSNEVEIPIRADVGALIHSLCGETNFNIEKLAEKRSQKDEPKLEFEVERIE